jgi:DNA-binding transcriptional MocR family regulator
VSRSDDALSRNALTAAIADTLPNCIADLQDCDRRLRLRWCRLPDGLDAGEVAQAALVREVVLAPGAAFSPSRGHGGYMRFNVAQMDDPTILSVLGDIMAKRP